MPPDNGFRHALQQAAAIQQAAVQPPPQVVRVLHPFNDVQLMALIAGHITATSGVRPEQAVEDAANIVALTLVRGVPILNEAMRRLGVTSADQVPKLVTG